MPSDRLKSPWVWWSALALYWLALFVATHLPSDVPLLPTGLQDKPVHLLAFAALAVLLSMAWHFAIGQSTWRQLFVAWLGLVLYAALDEWSQIPVGRDASVWDWLADAIGVALGLGCFAWLVRRRR